MDENKEELKVEETTAPQNVAEPQKEADTEEYYDDINYQDKATVEKVKQETRSVIREIFDWVVCFVIAYVLYLLINYFFFSAPGVSQSSMYPTVHDGERVIAVRTWMTGDFEYGEIVTFEAPIDNKYYLNLEEGLPVAQYEKYTGLTAFLYDFLDVNKVNYIKRIIGLPGDHIEIKDGAVYRNGEKLEENYVRTSDTQTQEAEYSDIVVPEGTVYVLGDNREKSKDSRTFGCIPNERVNGKVICRIWPLTKFGKID